MAAAVDLVFLASDNLIQVTKVSSKATGASINDATVTLLRLVEDLGEDADGNAIDGDTVSGSTDIDCPPVAGTDGAYNGILPHAVAATLTQGGAYAGYVEIDGGAGRLKTFRRKLRAVWANA